MKRYGKFWRNHKSWMIKKEKRDSVRLRRFFQLLKIEQDKTTPLPTPDFYSRVAVGLQKIEGDAEDRAPYLSCPRRTLPWALVTAGVISVIIIICSLHAPFSSKSPLSFNPGADEALFVLTPEVIILENLSETDDLDLNGAHPIQDSKPGAQNGIEWSNRICMLRNEDKLTSPTMHHSFRLSLPDLKVQKS